MLGSNKGGSNTTDRIIAQAYERQQQILLLGDQEGAALRKKIVAAGKQKIDEELNFMEKKQKAQERIARSETINHHRMLKIRRKYSLCQKIFEEVENRLKSIATNEDKKDEYKLFLIESIVDGLVRMFQEKIRIRCLEKDQALFKQLIQHCIDAYQEYMEIQIGFKYGIDLEIANNMILKERELKPYKPLEKAEQDQKCIGGVILADESGNITFKATFDSRLNILKQICLPDIRAQIWGEKSSKI